MKRHVLISPVCYQEAGRRLGRETVARRRQRAELEALEALEELGEELDDEGGLSGTPDD